MELLDWFAKQAARAAIRFSNLLQGARHGNVPC